MGFISKLLVSAWIGTLSVGAVELMHLDKHEKSTKDLQQTSYRVHEGAVPVPSNPLVLLEGPGSTIIEVYSDYIVDAVWSAPRNRKQALRNNRKLLLMNIAYDSGVPVEYEDFLRGIAENEKDPEILSRFLFQIKNFNDTRFAGILAARLNSGDLDRTNADIVRQILARQNPEFMLEYLGRRLSETPEREKPTYIIEISRVGGSRAIDIIMRHFDEAGLRYASLLMNAVRTYEDGSRVHDFLKDRVEGWQEGCSLRATHMRAYKKLADQYQYDGMKAMSCSKHDSGCYYRLFDSPVMPLRRQCDPDECRCGH